MKRRCLPETLPLIEPGDLMDDPIPPEMKSRLSRGAFDRTPPDEGPNLSLGEAVARKSAELWLTLGCPEEALRQLETLPSRVWMHPEVIRTRVQALKALRLGAR